MDNQQGVELNQLSRILFDRAAAFWQSSIVFELVAGVIGVIVSIAQPSLKWSTVWAIIGAAILCVAYYLRYKFEEKYDVSETMRRQSVLSEALNWPIGRVQFSEWKSRAGKRILEKFSQQQRPNHYYETTEAFGAKKLAEMTFESIFWTKNLYKKIRLYVLCILVTIAAAFFLVISLSMISFSNQDLRIYFIYTIYLLIPVLLTIDFLGLVIRTHRNIQSLNEIEKGVEKISQEQAPKIEEVMRLVSEYNCVVSTGIPIPNWLFKLHHDEIAKFWS